MLYERRIWMVNRPNVLIILSDQQRYDTIAAAGYPYMITPNLDRLASEGCLFSNAYSTNPVCMPARHDLLMGMPSAIHGFFANCNGKNICDYNVPTIPRLFTEAGYRTAAIGKMHFSPARMHHGYSEMYLMEELPRCRQDDAYATFLGLNGKGEIENLHGVRPLIYHEPQNAQVDDSLYETKWISDTTINWLKGNGDNPFMLCVGYIKPHPPWDVSQKYDNLYADKDIPDPVQRSRNYPYNPEMDPWYGDMDSDKHKREIRKAYYSCISEVDDSVGRIIEYLRDNQKLDNTLVIFTSDHGEMLQDKGYYSKEQPYEGSVHVPFIVRYPSQFKKNHIDNRFVDLTDIFPTCLSVSGILYPNGQYKLYGSSLAESDLQNDKDRSFVYSASGFLDDKRFVMCRNERYKYVYRYNNSTEELYDMINDPKETVNCIEQYRNTELHTMFVERVTEYEKKWGPKGAVVDGRLICISGKQFHGSVSGKYHLWSNNQFQNFTELKKDDRMKQFDTELNNAQMNKNIYECFNNDEWIKSYEQGRNMYYSNMDMDI